MTLLSADAQTSWNKNVLKVSDHHYYLCYNKHDLTTNNIVLPIKLLAHCIRCYSLSNSYYHWYLLIIFKNIKWAMIWPYLHHIPVDNSPPGRNYTAHQNEKDVYIAWSGHTKSAFHIKDAEMSHWRSHEWTTQHQQNDVAIESLRSETRKQRKQLSKMTWQQFGIVT